MLQAVRSPGLLGAAAVRFLIAGRAGIGALLKDLKTELKELQEALESIDPAAEDVYGESEEGLEAAAADLAYYLGAMRRASVLGQVVVRAVSSEVVSAAAAGVGREQRQFLKALRPKAQSVAVAFIEALAASPPAAAVHTGVQALLVGCQSEDGVVQSSPADHYTGHFWAVHAWVGLLVPAVQLALDAAALESSEDQVEATVKRIARQVLVSPALAALGRSAKAAVSGFVAETVAGRSPAAKLAAALMPLLRILSERILPAVREDSKHTKTEDMPEDGLEDGGETGAKPLCCLSEACPDLFESFVSMCGASTSCADSYLCRILVLDSLQTGFARDGFETQHSGTKALPADSSEGSARTCDVFTMNSMWMARLPDFREVAEAPGERLLVSNRDLWLESKRVSLWLGAPCEWLTLDPRRVQDTLDCFTFHTQGLESSTAATATAAFGAADTWDLKLLVELFPRQQQLLEYALHARFAVAGGTEDDERTAQSDEGRPLSAPSQGHLSKCLKALHNAVQSAEMAATTAQSSAYNVAYVVPYLAGRLSAACFVRLWRWQRLLESEQQYQQQIRSQREEEEARGEVTAWIAAAHARPVPAPEQARRACGVAGAWLRSMETEKTETSTDEAGAAKLEEDGDGHMENNSGTTDADTTAAAGNCRTARRRREDVWDMDEFSADDVRPAVERVSTFLKAARRVGRFWRPLGFPGHTGEAGEAASVDAETARTLEAWGAAIDDEDQWLSTFANGGGLQLLIMALGCQVCVAARVSTDNFPR